LSELFSGVTHSEKLGNSRSGRHVGQRKVGKSPGVTFVRVVRKSYFLYGRSPGIKEQKPARVRDTDANLSTRKKAALLSGRRE